MACVILGISAFFHDSAAALVRDGDIVAAAQEERFTRKKADSSFPRHAVAYCLGEAGIGPKDIDIAVFYENPLVKFERLVDTFATFAPEGEIPFRRAMRLWASERIDIPGVIRSELGEDFRGGIRCVGHHESHRASAYQPEDHPRRLAHDGRVPMDASLTCRSPCGALRTWGALERKGKPLASPNRAQKVAYTAGSHHLVADLKDVESREGRTQKTASVMFRNDPRDVRMAHDLPTFGQPVRERCPQ